MIIKALAQRVSPGGSGGRLSVLIFHRVLARPDALLPGEPDMRRFHNVVSWLSRWFNLLPLDHAVLQLRSGTLPARAAAISFDDGYADNYHHALPVLRHHRVPATFFVSTGFLDGGRMWNDSLIEAVRRSERPVLDLRASGLGQLPIHTTQQRLQAIHALLSHAKYLEPGQRRRVVDQVTSQAGAALPHDLMMRPDQLIGLRDAGMQIGAHTVSHPILERITDHQARWEISCSKQVLEAQLGSAVTLFAYPNGKPGPDYSERHVAMVREAGFLAAASTSPGAANGDSDPFQLPRFTPWDQTRNRFALRLLANARQGGPRPRSWGLPWRRISLG